MSVIATAVATIGAAGIWYASPEMPSLIDQATVTQPSTLTGPFTPTYAFLTPSLGWALVVDYSALTTRFFVFHTTDGAAHWYKQYVGKARGDRPYLHFFDAQHGFAYAGFSYRTVDGGAHWQAINVPGSQPYVNFASPTEGWAQTFRGGAQHIYRTGDGGRIWNEVKATPPGSGAAQPVLEPQTSTFSNDCEGWLGATATESPATVFVTRDCGATWRSQSLMSNVAPGSWYETAVKRVSGNLVVAFVSDIAGHVLSAFSTADHGDTWRGVAFPTRVSAPEAVSFVDAQHWWILGSGAIYTSNNAGSLWTHVHGSGIPEGWQFDVGQGIDAYHAWGILTSTAKSQLSRLVITTDGGSFWSVVSPPQP